jgi:DNA-binding response OmpR family regulator
MSESGKIRVLALEDDAASRELLLRQLMSHGMEVVLVRDGLDGLARLETYVPDVILCDVAMPGLDGLEFVKAVKAKKETQQIPVILLSANDDPATMTRGLDAGAHLYLQKPFRLDHLVAKIKGVVAHK